MPNDCWNSFLFPSSYFSNEADNVRKKNICFLTHEQSSRMVGNVRLNAVKRVSKCLWMTVCGMHGNWLWETFEHRMSIKLILLISFIHYNQNREIAVICESNLFSHNNVDVSCKTFLFVLILLFRHSTIINCFISNCYKFDISNLSSKSEFPFMNENVKYAYMLNESVKIQ